MNREPRESSLLTLWPFKVFQGNAGDNMVQHYLFLKAKAIDQKVQDVAGTKKRDRSLLLCRFQIKILQSASNLIAESRPLTSSQIIHLLYEAFSTVCFQKNNMERK